MENEALDANGTTAPADVQVLVQSGQANSKGGAGFVALVPKAGTAVAPDVEKNLVFSSLVRGDADITGLVAYSIYKQNKLDWLQAFEAVKSRAPDEAEVSAYIIGESTARRSRHTGTSPRPRWKETDPISVKFRHGVPLG